MPGVSVFAKSVCSVSVSILLWGCDYKSGAAVVLDKYYIEAAKPGETPKNARSVQDEQWIVKVEMVQDMRIIEVRAERAQYEKVKAGDRVKVRYGQGKYTGTVWDSEIVDR